MLRYWKTLAITCLIAGTGLFQTATLAEAQVGDVDPAPAFRLDAPTAVDTDATHLQKATSMYGIGFQTVGEGYTTIDSMTIRCPKGHCRIEVTAYMQVLTGIDDNGVAVCITFDGIFGSMECPRAAALQISDDFVGLNTVSGIYDVPKGNYDIGLQIHTTKGISYTRYTVNAKSFTRKP